MLQLDQLAPAAAPWWIRRTPRRSSRSVPCTFSLSPAASPPSVFPHPEARNPSHGLVAVCRRSEPPQANRCRRNMRLDVLYLVAEVRLMGRRSCTGIDVFPQVRRLSSSPTAPSPSTVCPRRANPRVEGKMAHRFYPFSPSPASGIADTVPLPRRHAVHACARG